MCTIHMSLCVSVGPRGVVPQKSPTLMHEAGSLCGILLLFLLPISQFTLACKTIKHWILRDHDVSHH